jgi:hypothetical protein
VLDALRRSPQAIAKAEIETLSKSGYAEVRGWASYAASVVLGTRAEPILRRLIRDKDPDVRDVALSDFMKLYPEPSPELTRMLRMKLRSKDYFEPVSALWALAKLHAAAATEDVAAFASNSDRDLWQRRVAEVVLTLLRGGSEALASRIAQHDHDHMQWLLQAATFEKSSIVHDAVVALVENAPDETCRDMARRTVPDLESM